MALAQQSKFQIYLSRLERYCREEAPKYFLQDKERHWFTLIPVFLGIGIFAYFMQENEPSVYLAPVAAVFIGLYSYTSYKEFKPGKALVLFYACLVAVGFGTAQLRTNMIATPMLDDDHGSAFVSGTIKALNDLPKGKRVLIVVSDVEGLTEIPKKVRLRSYHADKLAVGDQIKVLANLTPPSPPLYPGGFDFQRYAFFRQWGAVGYTLNEFEILDSSKKNTILSYVQSGIEKNLEENLDEASAIPKALLIGNRAGIVEDDLEAIRDAGLAHMLAISGLHVGLVAGFIFFLVRLVLVLFGRSRLISVQGGNKQRSWRLHHFYLNLRKYGFIAAAASLS